MSDQTDAPLFVIDDDPQVDWPVHVRLPVDGGKFAVFEFTVRMRVLSEEGYLALLADPAVAGGETEAAPRPIAEQLALNAERFGKVIIGWQGPARLDGTPVPFSADELHRQVTGPRGVWLSMGLYQAINEVRYGARLGNFAPPSVAG